MANLRASENPFPSVLFQEGTEPAAPDAGQQRLYFDSTTHLLKATNSSGTDRTIEGVPAGAITSSGLTMATARLLGRTTASTGAVEEISVGSGLSLSAGSLTATGGSGITAGTSFPGSPSTNDLYHRTDRGLIYYYDGTRWLTISEYRADLNSVDALQGAATALNIAGVTDHGANGMWITRYSCTTYTGGGGAIGSNYVSWQLRSRLGTGTVHTIGSTPTFATNADTQADYVTHTGTIGAAVTSGDRELAFFGTKTGSPTALYNFAAVFYRLIG